jgi:hypothetical protein
MHVKYLKSTPVAKLKVRSLTDYMYKCTALGQAIDNAAPTTTTYIGMLIRRDVTTTKSDT